MSESRLDEEISKLHTRLSAQTHSFWHPKVRQNMELCMQWERQSWILETASTICVPVF